ncbi:alpha/beta fold hydrolase [Bacillus lacus]|uniref:Alpha/beta fold hydrolase n=1 Tax=Metabacillus lacus TaxID=1983721 RepID=A0A7X2LYI7_9BACI|nr:alpha/beta hydrolase [Metabacillus lacus]MRX72381.1 alpha/beta fold hydrolase [Metabacillus lacus]
MRRITADNAKATIVCIHGAAEHCGRYMWLAEMWRSSGYNVIMGDLPGQGLTTRRRGHISSFDEYINEAGLWIAEAEKSGLPVFLLGHSMGGLVVIRSLQEHHHAVSGAILSSPCLGLKYKPGKALNVLSLGLNKIAPDMLFESKLSIDMATRNREVQDEDENDSLFVTKVSVRWYRELLGAVSLAFEKINALPDVPLLIMQAGEDKIVDREAVKGWFNLLNSSDKSYREWNGLYHELFSEPERDKVFKAALHFAEGKLTEKEGEI